MNRLPTQLLTRLAGTLLALSFAGSALAIAAPYPNWRGALDYSARFSSVSNDWQVFRPDGRSLRVLAGSDCDNTQAPPDGLWLLSRNGNGEPELVAPSALVLPTGHSGHVALLSCDAPAPNVESEVLRVPAQLMPWLTNNTGVVYVDH